MKNTALAEHEQRIRFGSLLGAMLLVLLIMPLVEENSSLDTLANLIFSLLLFAGLWSIHRHRSVVLLGVALVLPKLIYLWLPDGLAPVWLAWVGHISGLLFFFLLIASFLRFIATCRKVDLDIIFASVIVYLLIGVCWAFVYALLEVVQPGSFAHSNQASVGNLPFAYFSFVTLSTLGYGDIAPISEAARTFAVLEAIIGQLYLAILVASLVGIHLAEQKRGA